MESSNFQSGLCRPNWGRLSVIGPCFSCFTALQLQGKAHITWHMSLYGELRRNQLRTTSMRQCGIEADSKTDVIHKTVGPIDCKIDGWCICPFSYCMKGSKLLQSQSEVHNLDSMPRFNSILLTKVICWKKKIIIINRLCRYNRLSKKHWKTFLEMLIYIF